MGRGKLEGSRKQRNKRRPRKQRSCGKARFRDHDEAILALRRVTADHKHGRDGVKPVRVYECDRCGGYHLTSKERWGG